LKTHVTAERAKSIISRNQSPDICFSQSLNPYQGCEHGCIYCARGDTAILMSDGSTRPLEDIRVGDEIYGTAVSDGVRRYTSQRVLAHWSVTKFAHRILLQDGTELIAGSDHRFLTPAGWKFVVSAGSDSAGSRAHLVTTDRLFGPGANGPIPALGEVVTSDAQLRVVSIEPLETMRLYDITTETEDFIANGVVSHNCYARPSHGFRNLSPGIDFETRLFAKVNAAELLRKELSAPGYKCDEIMIGANTDPYQPIEREWKITRSVLEVCAEFNQPVGLITKNAGIERDIDILAPMAAKGLAAVTISCNNLDHDVARRLEPRCSAPKRRLQAMKTLSDAGIPVCVLVAPVVPFLTDQQIEPVLETAWEHGARQAGYVLLRLPWEVKDLFKDWLERNYPLKAKHIMSRVHEMREGRDNDPSFGTRMIGSGKFAELLEQRFDIACKRIGFNARRGRSLDKALFRVPGKPDQMQLF
ncbi:MAG: radical protein, partial [Betaproteobacteria bacterium]|nr:radical protein [Betaproteobacteria bacterium]